MLKQTIEMSDLERITCSDCRGVGRTKGYCYQETMMYGGKRDEYPCATCNCHGHIYRMKDRKSDA